MNIINFAIKFFGDVSFERKSSLPFFEKSSPQILGKFSIFLKFSGATFKSVS
jgi:hypothetical protein